MDLNLVKKQKVISAGGGAYVLKDYGMLYLEGKAKQGQKLEDVKSLMLGEIEKLKKSAANEDEFYELERRIVLQSIDRLWMNHIDAMSKLRD